MLSLPNRIFFTGVPGSRWSGIAQHIETVSGFNISDRTSSRSYNHGEFTGHKGAYFGRLMEFEARLDADYLDQAWEISGGTRLVKSHDWAYSLDMIRERFPNDWIFLVFRPNDASFNWWKTAGGFNITYPNYESYINDQTMQHEINWQNQCILNFAERHSLTWNKFTSDWVEQEFGQRIEIEKTWPDIDVALLK